MALSDPPSLQCSDTASGGSKSMDVFLGDMLIVAGQVVMAFQVSGVLERLVTMGVVELVVMISPMIRMPVILMLLMLMFKILMLEMLMMMLTIK